MDKVRGPNSKLVTNGPETQNENKHSSPDKIGRLQTLLFCRDDNTSPTPVAMNSSSMSQPQPHEK